MSSTTLTFPSGSQTIAAILYLAPTSTPVSPSAIVVSHPMSGVKEQTSTDYARVLAATGFPSLIFDAAYQGESTGLPRGLEDPSQRAEDIRNAVTFLLSGKAGINVKDVGVLGICASGGYASYAAQSDTRIKALATVSAACVGHMTRHGGVHPNTRESPEAIAGALAAASAWRTANPGPLSASDPPAPKMFDVWNVENVPDSFIKDAGAYYGTSRGENERSTQEVPAVSYSLMALFDAFAFQRLIAPRPVLKIAGSEAQTKRYSEEAIRKSEGDKELFIVEGKNHFDLYDDLTVSGPKVVEFFKKHLA